MPIYRSTIWRVLLTLIVLTLSSCGPTATPEVVVVTATATPVVIVVTATPAPTEPPTTEPTATQPPTPEPDPTEPQPDPTESLDKGTVSNLEGVKSATIQIVTEGSFVNPETGQQEQTAGAGSGFIIDPSGIAVTNNHVVTGGAIWKVRIGGEGEWKRAKVLGVSECSDLAVIDIDGEGFPYLTWYDGSIEPPLRVYAAGFPLGDPEYTLTEGVVSKARADGQTPWASNDAIIEHSAPSYPGNSGGPLVTQDGKVVGVHYAGSNIAVNQHFAIARNEALKVIDQLKEGQDVDAIGLNGQAIKSEDGSIAGIWVSSVKTGSPASKAGIKGGDIIFKIEGLDAVERGPNTAATMTNYCDILRSRGNSEAAFNVAVFRSSTKECLAGEINGEKLQPVDCASLSLIPQDSDVANAPNSPSPPPSGGGGGLYQLTLGKGSQSGSIGAGRNQWFVFSSGENNNATVVVFLRNTEKAELFLYDQKTIPDGRIHPEPDQLPNFGAGTEQGNRDNDDNTKEIVWAGPIEKNSKYYVRLVNRGNTTLQFCLAPRDAYSCP